MAETHPLLPTEANSAHKALATLYQEAYHRAFGLETIALRLTNIYGPRMFTAHHRLGFINWFVRQAVEGQTLRLYGDGSQVRDLVYIDDCVRCFLLAAVTPEAKGQALNMGSGAPVSLKQIACTLVGLGAGGLELLPFPEEAKRIEIGDYVADTKLTRETLGWLPEISLQEGLKRSVDYYRCYREHYW